MVKIVGYLAQRRAGYEAVVDVPPSKRESVGRKRLRKGLGTREVHLAKALLPKALAELHNQIAAALRGKPSTDPLTAEALAFREHATAIRAGDLSRWSLAPGIVGEDAHGPIERHPRDQATELLADGVARRAEQIEREQGAARAHAFAGVALGDMTPWLLHVDQWLSQPGAKGAYKGRTALDYRRIVETFAEWAHGENVGTVEALTRRVAGRYLAKMHDAALSSARIRTVVSALSSYWDWMEQRGLFAQERANPWKAQAPAKRAAANQAPERDFTGAELEALFTRAPDRTLHDLMALGALTGARIEEICQLTVGRCAGGVFDMPGTKTDAAARQVPIHPALSALVAARCSGQGADAYLLAELGEPNRHGERSAAVGKRFNRWRESVGVHDRPDDRRRSRVNFHSFRRWFITAALRAGQAERLVEQLVGHRSAGMTRGVYFQGDTIEAKAACVMAVSLPDAALESLSGVGSLREYVEQRSSAICIKRAVSRKPATAAERANASITPLSKAASRKRSLPQRRPL